MRHMNINQTWGGTGEHRLLCYATKEIASWMMEAGSIKIFQYEWERAFKFLISKPKAKVNGKTVNILSLCRYFDVFHLHFINFLEQQTLDLIQRWMTWGKLTWWNVNNFLECTLFDVIHSSYVTHFTFQQLFIGVLSLTKWMVYISCSFINLPWTLFNMYQEWKE